MPNISKCSQSADKQIISKLLNDDLLQEIHIEIYMKILMQCKFFMNFSKEFCQHLCQALETKVYGPKEIIFKQGQRNCNIYFVEKGEVLLNKNYKMVRIEVTLFSTLFP